MDEFIKDIVILTALAMALLSGEYSMLFQVQFQVCPQYCYQVNILLSLVYAIGFNFCLDQIQRARHVRYRYNLPMREQAVNDLPPNYEDLDHTDENTSNETSFAFPPPPIFDE